MKSTFTLSLFLTRSQESLLLKEMLLPIAEKMGFTVQTVLEPNPIKYAQACWNDDVVILDASIEKKGSHNYEIALPTPLDHVLVVSRTYLPINFYGLRDSAYDHETRNLIYNAPFYPYSQPNELIARWVDIQLQDLIPFLPRPKQQKGIIGSIFKGMSNGYNMQDQRRKETGQIFISYRSQDAKGVEELKRRIEKGDFHNGQSKIVRYFPPAVLSDEIMTEQRRWQMLSMIDWFIAPADEIWVYEGDEYYDSWWTLGELATIAYRAETGYREKPMPKLKIFVPQKGVVYNAPQNYLPIMNDTHKKRMARWYANTDTAEMGPESITAIRLLGQLPILNRFSYFQDHVWTEQFWKDPILDCKKCRCIGKQRNQFDIDAFLWTKDPGFFRFASEQVKRCADQEEIICPMCKTPYRITKSPPHYLWMPTVNGHKTGEYWMLMFGIEPVEDDEYSLIPMPVYRLG